MLQYQIRRGRLVSLSYRTGDVSYNLGYLRGTPAWGMIEQLILAGDVAAAEQLYKTAFSIAASQNWTRVKSGHWTCQYGGHIIYVRSDGDVQVFLLHANPTSRVSKDLALKSAEVAYYLRRRWYDQKAAQTARRDARRTR